ncbi:MAG: tetratricopeptide repeat protein [Cyanobacteria bacterium P01_C01_bin.89]
MCNLRRYEVAAMGVWGGAIAIGLLLGTPFGALALEPQRVEGKLTTDNPQIEDGSYAAVYEFQGQRGDQVAIELDSDDFDAYLLLRFNEETIAQDDDSGVWHDALIVLELPADGTYQVVVNTASSGEVGHYRLHWRPATDTDSQRQEAYRLQSEGEASYRRNGWDAAIESLQQAQVLYQQLDDARGKAYVINIIGLAFNDKGEYDRALALLEESLAISEDIDFITGQDAALGNIANVYQRRGEFEQALGYTQRALALSRQLGNVGSEGVSLGNLGFIYDELGQYAKALEYLQQALDISRQVGDRATEGTLLNNIGLSYDDQGQHPKALEYLQQALVIRRELETPADEGATLSNIGVVYVNQGKLDLALEHFQAALALSQQVGDPFAENTVLNNIALVYSSQGKGAQALEFYQRSLAISQRIGDRAGVGTALNNLGLLHSEDGNYEAALEHLQRAFSLMEQMGDRLNMGTTLGNLGQLYAALEEYPKAEAKFRESVAVLEAVERDLPTADQSRIAFFETQSYIYSFLQGTLLAQGKAGGALEIADRSRARSLAQFLNPSTTEQPRSPLNLAQIQSMAREKNATLIAYSINYEQLNIWVVDPSGTVTLRQGDPAAAGLSFEAIASQIQRSASAPVDISGFFSQEQFRISLSSLRGGEGSAWRGEPKDLKRAYQLLIEPIEDLLPDGESGNRLIIVPHRELGTVPFSALIDGGDRFLLDRYAITVTPSLDILNAVQQKSPTTTGSPLIVGNPSPMPEQLSPLPGAEVEAQDIATALKTTPLIGNQATEATVKQRLENASILHFATHGIVANSDRDIQGNWLALAETGGGEDGKLTLAEIFNSNLNAQLAVLSACNTVSGEVTGEGVLGLARAFLKAGVPTVIASLWQVPDEQTRILMEAFYQELLAGRTYAEALRTAQLKVRAQSTNPRNWAAFMVIGDGDRTLRIQ